MTFKPRATETDRFYSFLALGVAIIYLILSVLAYRLPFAHYLRDLNIDDSFYYLEIARHLASGDGSTFDGINPTNGYHPLWAFFLTSIHKFLADPITVVRATKALEIGLLGLSSLIFVQTARLARWPAFLLLPPLLFWLCMKHLYEGMEAGLHFLLLNAVLLAFCVTLQKPARGSVWLVFGVLCCLLPWCRLESALLAISLPVLALLTLRPQRPTWLQVSIGLIPLLTLGAYFTYNWELFGSISPISGAVKRHYSSVLWEEHGGYNPFKNGISILRIAPAWQGLALTLLSGLWLRKQWKKDGTRVITTKPQLLFLMALAGLHCAFVVYAILFLYPAYARYGHYYTWLPLMVAILFVDVTVRTFASSRNRAVAGSVVLACIFLSAFIRQVNHSYSSRAPSWGMSSYNGAQWLNEHVAPSSLIAMNSAGVVGYFAHAPVVNTDGLVNSQDYFRALRSAQVSTWFESHGITHFAGMLPTSAPQESDKPVKLLQDGTAGTGVWRKIYVDSVGVHISGEKRYFTVYSYDNRSR
jgi:hypothetical protein